MVKKLNFKGKNENFFFLGCLHHNHVCKHWTVPLWKMRGFDSVEEHNQFQIQKWNEVCDENSIVFLLGDTIFDDPKGLNFINLLNRLRFSKLYAQPGNHFSGWLQNYKKTLGEKFPGALEQDRIIYEVYPLQQSITFGKDIFFIPNYAELDINGLQIVISHYAIRSWNQMSKNSIMLHSHEHLSSDLSDWENLDNGKIADVGYESLLKYNNGAPISLEKLMKYMHKKQYKSEGHH
jgi:calcineurin-like phosphoesterase family protein